MERRETSLFVVTAFGLLIGTVVAQQSSSLDDERRAQIEKQLEAAREGSPVVRPQAARRLSQFGEDASRVVMDLSKGEVRELASLGKDVVEVLGTLPGDELRTLLWRALDDPDFPWRPAAARTLARTARPEEADRFLALSRDPISYVRAASVQACRQLTLESQRGTVRGLLADPDDLVRRDAADLLASWGERSALAWTLEELRRDDRFFDRALGKTARYAAARMLQRHLGDLGDYDPGADPRSEASARAVDALVAALRESEGELPELPFVARAATDHPVDRLGLEVRSCRRGEFFLRWCDGDVLLVGLGNPRSFALPDGSVERLLQRAADCLEELGGQNFFGEPGCDVELVHLRAVPGERARVLSVSKGPDPVADLRPAPLEALVQELVETLDQPEVHGALPGLPNAVREALGAVGGVLQGGE